MKKNKQIKDFQITSFIEGEDDDGHFKLDGDLAIAGIIDCEKTIHCLRFHPNGEIFAVGFSDGTIKGLKFKIFKKSNNEVIYSLMDDDIRTTRLPVTCIRFFNPENDPNIDHYRILIASYVTGFVKYWHYPSKSCIYTIVDKITQPLTIDFNNTFTKLAVGGYNDQIKVYDVATKKLVNTLESSAEKGVNGHSSRVYCLKYHPNDQNQLLSGGWDDTIQVWDDRLPHSQNYIYGPHITGEALDIDAAHNHLLSGSWRKTSTLQIWDLRNYSLIRDVFKNKSNLMMYGAQWLGTDYIFACGSEKNSAVIYDRGYLKAIAGLYELKNAVTSIANDGIGEMPNLLVASRCTLYQIRKKTPTNYKSDFLD